jgi:type I site-specific restriction endonuclease
MKPEQKARQNIDAQLQVCGWFVQDHKAMDLSAGRGIALREVPLTTGPCDYLLLVDRKPVGVVEAKKKAPRSPPSPNNRAATPQVCPRSWPKW